MTNPEDVISKIKEKIAAFPDDKIQILVGAAVVEGKLYVFASGDPENLFNVIIQMTTILGQKFAEFTPTTGAIH